MGNDCGKVRTSTSTSCINEDKLVHSHQGYPGNANTDEERRKRMAAIEARLRAEASRGIPQHKGRK